MALKNVVMATALLCLTAAGASGADVATPTPAVTVTETAEGYTLANGMVTAKVAKRSAKLTSLVYDGIEILDRGRCNGGGYWSHVPAGPQVVASITIDPKTNGGERAEVSIKGPAGGGMWAGGPGAASPAAGGSGFRGGSRGGFRGATRGGARGPAVDIEIRYALGRGDSGVYTYSILDHKAEYPATSIGEARFCAKLNDDVFDWMTVDARRNRLAITAYDWNHGTELDMKEVRRMNSGAYKGQVEHKYDYSAVQFDTPAYGWSSTRQGVGVWFVNPSIEYLSGGPTKVELLAHRDATFGSDLDAPAAPCLLNYWRGSHYGGSSCVIAAGERWTKVVGPFLIYCNAGPTPDAMWRDALSRAGQEARAWPYGWVNGVDYPHKEQRGTVSGQVVLDDPQAPAARMSNLLVGLAAPDYAAGSGRGGSSVVDWQLDAKHYQFWVRGDPQGRFSIANVRPGTYTLHAIADGVLGECARADVTVAAGQTLDLGQIDWKPTRHGQQVWEIGTPDRTAGEFRHGDHYWQWGLYYQYPKEFPDDVNFVFGRSNPRTDWNYAQLPRADRPDGTPWSITFDLPSAPRGKATLRLAFAATSARRLDVSVNGQSAGEAGPLRDTATIRRDGIRGYWYERAVTFDAGLLKEGTNVLKLTIPPGGVTSGIEYDYLRLELAPAAGK